MQLKPDEFWKLTYAEFVAMLEGYVRRQKRRTNERTADAWNTAYFSRVKRLPELKGLLIDEDEVSKKPDQTDEQMTAMIRMLNAAWGGVVEEQE